MPSAPDGQNDDLTEDEFNDINDFDDELTEEELEELEEDLEDDPYCGCSFTFKLSLGTLDEEDEEDEDDDEAAAVPTRDWYDISQVNPAIFQTVWIEPEAAQRLMDRAKASGITAEQAYGWMLLRAYGRTSK